MDNLPLELRHRLLQYVPSVNAKVTSESLDIDTQNLLNDLDEMDLDLATIVADYREKQKEYRRLMRSDGAKLFDILHPYKLTVYRRLPWQSYIHIRSSGRNNSMTEEIIDRITSLIADQLPFIQTRRLGVAAIMLYQDNDYLDQLFEDFIKVSDIKLGHNTIPQRAFSQVITPTEEFE